MRQSLAEGLAERVVILDGGLATQLEAQGADLSGGMWSARLLFTRRDRRLVEAAHRAFFAAGAEVATTASYQASAMSLERAELEPAELEPAELERGEEEPAELEPERGEKEQGEKGARLERWLLSRSVLVASEARDAVCPQGWVAGSVGPYGASLADGSEYTGRYGLGSHDETVRALRRFHRPRLRALLVSGADVLACETVPSLAEAEALAAELAALDKELHERPDQALDPETDGAAPSWLSVTVASSRGRLRTRAGDPLADVAAVLRDVPGLLAVGVNCCDPRDVAPAVAELVAGTGLPGVVYPNSGETWDAGSRSWAGRSRFDEALDDGLLDDWLGAGVRLVGGCCRVSPDQIRRLAQAVATSGGSGDSPHRAWPWVSRKA